VGCLFVMLFKLVCVPLMLLYVSVCFWRHVSVALFVFGMCAVLSFTFIACWKELHVVIDDETVFD